MNKCTICGFDIESDSTFIGNGGGAGQRFAHDTCYYRRDLAARDERIRELEREIDTHAEECHPQIETLEQQLVERNREIKNLKDVIAAPEKPRYAQLLEQIREVEQQLKTAQERIRELEQQLRAMKECSDGNFASYERVKAQLSDCVTSHQKRNAELAEYERAFCDAHQPDGEPTDIECSRCLAVHLEQQLKTAQERLAEANGLIEECGSESFRWSIWYQRRKEYFAKHSPSSGKEQG